MIMVYPDAVTGNPPGRTAPNASMGAALPGGPHQRTD
jgi:hypothetical protein